MGLINLNITDDTIITANGTPLTLKPINNSYKGISGIYLIFNKVNNKCYVGQTNNLYRRRMEHIYDLEKNNHRNSYLQNSFNKYGLDNFEFYIILSNINNLNDGELEYIKLLDTRIRNYGYNLRLDTFSRDKENISKTKGMILPLLRKPVVQLDLDGNYINKYDCARDAAADNNIHFSTISKCCKNQRRNAGGYMWIFEESYLDSSYSFEDYFKDVLNIPLFLKNNPYNRKIKKDVVVKRTKRKDYKKPVFQIDSNGELIKEWDYVAQTKEFGFNPNKIYECCSGKIKTHKGFCWKYK